jgi:hypothetical protein
MDISFGNPIIWEEGIARFDGINQVYFIFFSFHVHHPKVELLIAWLIAWRERQAFVSIEFLDDEVSGHILGGVTLT